MFDERLVKIFHLFFETEELLRLERQETRQCFGNRLCLVAKLCAFFGEVNKLVAAIFLERFYLDEAFGFELLQKRSQRAGVEVSGLGDRLNIDAVLLPKRHHDQVLRVGKPQRVENAFIDSLQSV